MIGDDLQAGLRAGVYRRVHGALDDLEVRIRRDLRAAHPHLPQRARPGPSYLY